MMKVNYKKLDDKAVTPSCGSEYSAGMDLSALIQNGATSPWHPAGGTLPQGTGI